MSKTSDLTAITASQIAPTADVVPIADISATETKKATPEAIVEAGRNGAFRGSVTMSSNLTVDGGLSYDIELNDVNTLTLDAQSLNLSGVANVSLNSTGAGAGQGEVEVRADQALKVLTPDVVDGVASLGGSLTLTDQVDGLAEFVSATYSTVAAMKAAPRLVDGGLYATAGYHSAGDGGHGTYRYVAASAATTDGGLVHAHNTLPGRLQLLNNGVVNVKQFGARGDASTDDTAAIQAALDAVVVDTTPSTYPFGGTYGSGVYLPPGQYNINSTLTIRRGTNLFGDSRASAVINVTVSGVTGLLYYKSGSANLGGDARIANLTIKTESNTWTPTSGAGLRLSSSYMEGTVVSYSAGTPSVVLGGNASSVTGEYVGRLIYIGASASNSATVTAYDGVTKTATLSAPFPVAANPGNQYNVIGSGQNNVIIDNVAVYGKFYDGFWIEATVVTRVFRCRAALCVRYGFRVEDTLDVTPTSTTFSECYSTNSGSHGYYLRSTRYCALHSCASDANAGDAYALSACQQLALTGCGAEGNTGSGISLATSFGISVVSCHFTGCGTHAVSLSSSGQNMASGCIFNPTSAANNAVRIASASANAAQGNDIICIGCDSTATTFTNNYSVVTTIQRNGLTHLSGSVSIGAGASNATGQKVTRVKHGAATLVGGTVVVSEAQVTASSRILLTSQVPGGTVGFLSISARSAGTSFTILSSSALDTSTVGWLLIEP